MVAKAAAVMVGKSVEIAVGCCCCRRRSKDGSSRRGETDRVDETDEEMDLVLLE